MNITRRNRSKFFVSIICAVLCLMFIYSPVAAADTGPKPSITITVKNAPDEPYYIGLLEEGKGAVEAEQWEWYRYESANVPDEVSDIFVKYYEDGFRLHVSPVGSNILPSNDSGEYRFGYMVPYTFKVLIVTEDRDVYVSDVCTREQFYSQCTYDVAGGEVTEDQFSFNNVVYRVAQAVAFFFVTILVESLVLLVFRLFNNLNYKHFIKINIITQIFLNLVLVGETVIRQTFNVDIGPLYLWIGAECIIILVESLYYLNRLKTRDGRVRKVRNVVFGIVANLVSILVEIPVWFILLLGFRMFGVA